MASLLWVRAMTSFSSFYYFLLSLSYSLERWFILSTNSSIFIVARAAISNSYSVSDWIFPTIAVSEELALTN